MLPEFLFNLPQGDIAYDTETYPNVFTFRCRHVDLDRRWSFEISPRRNDLELLILFIKYCQINGNRWVGFNNIGFDYPIVHWVCMNASSFIGASDIYNKAMSIINAHQNAKFAHMVWESDWLVPQIDLYKIHHFDNMARATSLKVLEFNMRMADIEDLPFEVGTELNDQQIETLCQYNDHDVDATVKFYHESKDQINFREELTEKYDKNFLNHNDTKIGKDYFIMELEKASPGCCYRYTDGKRQMVQTVRDKIDLGDVVLPYVKFNHPEFNRILEWFKSQVITETKGVFKDISCSVNGFEFDFGTGGIHGSISSTIVESDDDNVIIDLDVASYYPNLAIVNRLYPQHIGDTFCRVYKEVYEMRKGYEKGTTENAMLKLALNGVYGDSNNKYSPFFDPQYTMSITINGQLLLCMLAEALMGSPDVQMIQINTDGLTIRCPRSLREWVISVCEWWEQLTGLQLESAFYNRMMIRDVNNYIAEYTDGKLKRKGAYEYELGWHQNHSALIVPKAAEAALVHGSDIRSFIINHNDIFDFFLRAKVPRSTVLEWGGEKVANIVRYFVSISGRPLEKVMPPAGPRGAFKKKNGVPEHYYQEILKEVGDAWDERIHTKNKSTYEERRTGINTGWNVELCNSLGIEEFDDIKFVTSIDRENINYEWYIKEARKLADLMSEDDK
jgi:hypothetical protein